MFNGWLQQHVIHREHVLLTHKHVSVPEYWDYDIAACAIVRTKTSKLLYMRILEYYFDTNGPSVHVRKMPEALKGHCIEFGVV